MKIENTKAAADLAGAAAFQNQLSGRLTGESDGQILAQPVTATTQKITTCFCCRSPSPSARAYTVRRGLPLLVRPICTHCVASRRRAPRVVSVALRLACALARVRGGAAC